MDSWPWNINTANIPVSVDAAYKDLTSHTMSKWCRKPIVWIACTIRQENGGNVKKLGAYAWVGFFFKKESVFIVTFERNMID